MLKTADNMMQLNLQLKQTANLISVAWTDAGDPVAWEIPATNGAAFCRVHAD